MAFTVFFSWQSDLPNSIGRGFIGDALEKAIRDLNKKGEHKLDIAIDRDTKDTPGSPDIKSTIFDKIERADAFVADISIITGSRQPKKRFSPNPNVLIELGFAISILSWDRIILVSNEQEYNDHDYPFDIRAHKRITYSLNEGDPKPEEKKKLISHLKSSIDFVVQRGQMPSMDRTPTLKAYWKVISHETGKEFRQIETKKTSIEVHRLSQIDDPIERLKKDESAIALIDGSIDKKWNNKVASYLRELKAYERKISSEQALLNMTFYANSKILTHATPLLENLGSNPATSVKMELQLPNWILVSESYPTAPPEYPTTPKPVAMRATNIFDQYQSASAYLSTPRMTDIIIPNFNSYQRINCQLRDNNTITFELDTLLHKHEQSGDKSFFLLASHDAPVGRHEIPVKIFCLENDDWQNEIMGIHVTQ